MDESHKSSPLDQLGVFTYQSLTLIRILVVCSVTLNRFQCNESQCLTPKSPSPGVEPGTWGWVPQILVYFVNWHCSPPKYFPVRELNPGLEGESHKSSPLDQLGVFTYQSLTLIRILVVFSVTLNRFQCNESQCLTPKSPSPGVEPGTWGWKPQILTARPTGSVHVSIPNSYSDFGRLFSYLESISM